MTLRFDLEAIYPSIGSEELKRDVRFAYEAVRSLKHGLGDLAEVDRLLVAATSCLGDVHVYCTALLAIGEDVGAASAMLRRVSAISAELDAKSRPYVALVLDLDPADYARFLEDTTLPTGAAQRWNRRREHRGLAAADDVERTVSTLGPEAFRAWIKLYDAVADGLVVRLPDGDCSLAEAMSVLEHPREALRRAAWEAIHRAWAPHETTVAAVLSSVVAYRAKVQSLRAPAEDFLDASLRENRMSRATLDRLFAALDARRSTLERAPRLMARFLDKPVLEPWDLAASSAHEEAPIPIEHALDAIRAAFADVDPEMGTFVETMRSRRWIDARPPAPGRRHGAYQTSLQRGKHALVFASYEGRRLDVSTLAHELGHAFQYHVTRDAPPEAHKLPPALAEIASSFAEIVLQEHWLSSSDGDPIEALHYAWIEAQNASAFLLVMPASFTFECGLYEARRKGPLAATDLSQRLAAAWSERFGDAMTTADDRGWIRKRHFANARAFYNHPYVIGWLVGVLLQDVRTREREAFPALFRAFLADATTLGLDALLERHFGTSPSTIAFWDRALDLVEERLARAEAIAANAVDASHTRPSRSSPSRIRSRAEGRPHRDGCSRP